MVFVKKQKWLINFRMDYKSKPNFVSVISYENEELQIHRSTSVWYTAHLGNLDATELEIRNRLNKTKTIIGYK